METDHWLDKAEYPFVSHYMELATGKIHYVDEGNGQPIVMIHGNPTWSFLYRNFIKELSHSYRCIAVDHLGFGLSDKPIDWSYTPAEHAKNLSTFIKNLQLKDAILVVQDWGGPIGLSYALEHAETIKGLVVMNTWMWSVKGDPHYERFSAFMGGGIGRFLIRKFNFFARVVMKQATADKSVFTPQIHNHYLSPLQSESDRKGCWRFPREIIQSDRWLNSLWEQRERIQNIPTLVLWGMKDIAFREKELKRWVGLFANCEVHEYMDAGHYIQEEKHTEAIPAIKAFLEKI